MSIDWTREQRRAIDYRQQHELLVSAAAGSGKTTVMSERVIHRCLTEGLNPEDFVILTFTEKAKTNMQHSLEKNLQTKLKDATLSPQEKSRVRDLQNTLQLAQVSTNHSFCKRLIQEYRHLLTDASGQILFPDMPRTMDEDEAKILLKESVEEVLAEIYRVFLQDEKEPDWTPLQERGLELLLPCQPQAWFQDFLQAQGIAGGQKSNDMFQERLLGDYLQLRNLPHYLDRMRDFFRELMEQEENFPDSAACRYFLNRYLLPALQEASAYWQRIESHPFSAFILSFSGKTQMYLSYQDMWPRLRDFILETTRITGGRSRAEDLTADERARLWTLANRMGPVLQEYKFLNRAEVKAHPEKLEFRDLLYEHVGPLIYLLGVKPSASITEDYGLAGIPYPFALTLEEMRGLAQAGLPAIARYLEVLALLDRRYQKQKLARQVIDFSDYEHLALDLVERPEVKQDLVDRYEEILSDEYQDTSPLQETLLQRVGAKRITMLGDMKQSIYRFRNADPAIFSEKLTGFTNVTDADPEPDEPGGALVLLNHNFRSRPQLLTLINDFFRSFLRQETGGITYDDSQALVPGLGEEKFPQRNRPMPAFHVQVTYDAGSAQAATGAEEAAPGSSFTPSHLSLLRAVTELVEAGYALPEIAVLARTKSLVTEAIEVLQAAGIPCASKLRKEFLHSPERRLLKELVSFLANSAQDLPLLAVMRSGFMGVHFLEADFWAIARGGTTLDGKAEQSVESLQEPVAPRHFYAHFRSYAEQGENLELQERCRKFIAETRAWRQKARYLSLDQLLSEIIEQSHIRDLLSSLPFGEQRLSDLDSFLDLARRYAQSHPHDLAGFAGYLDQIEARQISFEEDQVASDDAQAIRIYTMHGAKGLEFPAVIYYEANHLVRGQSRQNPVIFHDRLGLAANYRDGEVEYYSPRYLYFTDRLALEEAGEQYRLLYVTLTRAKEVVYICAGKACQGKTSTFIADLEKQAALARKDLSKTQGKAFSDLYIRSRKTDFDLLWSWLAGSLPGLLQMTPTLGSGEAFQQTTDGMAICVEEAGMSRAKLVASLAILRTQPPAAEATDTAAADFINMSAEELQQLLHFNLLSSPGYFLPSKITVTALQEEAQAEAWDEEREVRSYLPAIRDMALHLTPAKPLESSRRGLTATEEGSFLHRIFQLLDPETYFSEAGELLPRSVCRERYRRFIEAGCPRLREERDLAIIAEAAFDYVFTFLQSPIARDLMQAERAGRLVARELPFTMGVPASSFIEPQVNDRQGVPAEDSILVQGAIDLFYDRGEVAGRPQTILVDYKSNQLQYLSPAAQDQYLQKQYGEQLSYYAKALKRLRQAEVNKAYIWLIRHGRAVEIKCK